MRRSLTGTLSGREISPAERCQSDTISTTRTTTPLRSEAIRVTKRRGASEIRCFPSSSRRWEFPGRDGSGDRRLDCGPCRAGLGLGCPIGGSVSQPVQQRVLTIHWHDSRAFALVSTLASSATPSSSPVRARIGAIGAPPGYGLTDPSKLESHASIHIDNNGTLPRRTASAVAQDCR